MEIYIQKIVYLVGIKICYKQGRSQVFIEGGGQAVGNDKFVNKTLQQNINPKNSLL